MRDEGNYIMGSIPFGSIKGEIKPAVLEGANMKSIKADPLDVLKVKNAVRVKPKKENERPIAPPCRKVWI